MWSNKSLGDIVEILDNQRKPITKKNREEGNIPYYGATGIVDWVIDYIFDEKLVLVGEDGAKWAKGDKTAFIIEGKTWVNNHAHVLRPKAEILMHEWLTYYLTAIDLRPWVTGLTVPKLNQAQLRSIPIPLPPLEEQQTIVAKLNTAFAEIKKLINSEKNKIKIIEKLKVQILNSKLNNLNNVYKKTNIGEICELAYGKGLDKSDRKEDSGFPAFGANGIKYFATKYLYDKPSIIVGRKGSAGELKYVKEPFWALDVTYYIKHNSELVNLKYLYYLLKLQNLPSFAKGVKPGINRNEVYSIPILLPTLEKQKIIAKEIDNAFKQFEIINKLEKLKLENYEKLKTSLLNDKLQSKVA